MSIEHRKSRLINRIRQTLDESIIRQVEQLLGTSASNESYLAQYEATIRPTFDLEGQIRAQGYVAPAPEKLLQIANEMQLDEDLNQLLEDLR